MFGYVRPLTGELKVAEYEKYRGVYCGLCRVMGQVTGQISRLTLSYDMVMLAAVRMILTGIQPEFLPLRCAAHPMNRRAVLCANDARCCADCAGAADTGDGVPVQKRRKNPAGRYAQDAGLPA